MFPHFTKNNATNVDETNVDETNVDETNVNKDNNHEPKSSHLAAHGHAASPAPYSQLP